jgi:hypothetical protein
MYIPTVAIRALLDIRAIEPVHNEGWLLENPVYAMDRLWKITISVATAILVCLVPVH